MTSDDTGPPALAEDAREYELTLFVSGASEHSARAITNATLLCDAHLNGRYRLSVVDVHDNAAAALRSRVLTTPTLVRERPLPVRRIAGDLRKTDEVLRTLVLAGDDTAAGVPR